MFGFFNKSSIASTRFSAVTSALLFSVALLGASGTSGAQNYPARPIKLLVPFAAGGSPDVVARNIALKLSERLAQSVIVENRLGAGGNIAYGEIARSAPNGYSLLFATNGIATNMSLYKQLPFNTATDFAPILLVSRGPHVLVVHPSVPANSVQQLIAYARANPEKLSFGSSGYGTVPHLAGELFGLMTGVKLLHVPYKGMSPAQTDLLGGSIQLIFSDVASSRQHIKAGNLRALGVTGKHRLSFLPDIPTIAEAGVDGYAIEGWFGILAPAGTPPAIVHRLNRELALALVDPDLKRRMQDLGQEMVGDTPEEFSVFLRDEISKMGGVVKALGLMVD